jgi:hypothetical protein
MGALLAIPSMNDIHNIKTLYNNGSKVANTHVAEPYVDEIKDGMNADEEWME